MFSCSNYQAKKLQNVQNRALRSILKIKYSERITNLNIHNKLKIKPLNHYLAKLFFKAINKIKGKYLLRDEMYEPFYKLDPVFEISIDPHRNKQDSLAEHIINTVFYSIRTATFDDFPFDDLESFMRIIEPIY